RIAEFRARVDAHREMVRDEIDAQLEKSRKELIDHFLPLAVRRPPDALLGKLLSDPSEDQVRAWLDRQLSSTFPKAADLIDGMSLDVQFRDVTYDTLHDKRFTCKLQQKFPEVDWDRPLKEFDAAPERNDQRQPAS